MFAGRPEGAVLDRFRHYDSEGLDVYVHPSLQVSEEGMEISLVRWAFLRRLKVAGVTTAA